LFGIKNHFILTGLFLFGTMDRSSGFAACVLWISHKSSSSIIFASLAHLNCYYHDSGSNFGRGESDG
jgi:hypothetical protein